MTEKRQAFLADIPEGDPAYLNKLVVDQYVAGWMYCEEEDLVFRYVAMSDRHLYVGGRQGFWGQISEWGSVLLMMFGPLWSWALMLFDDGKRTKPRIKAFRTVRMPLANIDAIESGGFLETNGVKLTLKKYPAKPLLPGQKENRLEIAFPDGYRKHAREFLSDLQPDEIREPDAVPADS